MGKEQLPFGVITPEFIKGKRVIIRADIDALTQTGIEEYRLVAGSPTLELCRDHDAEKVIIIGHVGRPKPEEAFAPEYSVAPIRDWLSQRLGTDIGLAKNLEEVKTSNTRFVMLENIRFFKGETDSDINFARKLAALGNVFVNESFATSREAASTTQLPTLLKSVAGLRFREEVERLTAVRENPARPFVVIMGGAKVKDKKPFIEAFAKTADLVLVGGGLIKEITKDGLVFPKHVIVGSLNPAGTDITPNTTAEWQEQIKTAKTIVLNGPVGIFEEGNDQTGAIAKAVLDSGATIVIGGGNTIDAFSHYDLLETALTQDNVFISTGGGSMLEFFEKGTLPTIIALIASYQKFQKFSSC